MKEALLWTAGIGVDTPRAFASFAKRCGGSGDLGGAHVGDNVEPRDDVDRCEDRGVPFALALAAVTLLDMMKRLFEVN